VSHNIGNSVAEKRKLAVGSGIRNSNLLGMGRTTSSCALLFFGWARPESYKLRASKRKISSLTMVLGYYKILKTNKKEK